MRRRPGQRYNRRAGRPGKHRRTKPCDAANPCGWSNAVPALKLCRPTRTYARDPNICPPIRTEVTPHATGGNSAQFQGQFASGIASEVVGVALEDVNVSRVAGSSLTSGGFNAAIDTIQAEAQA